MWPSFKAFYLALPEDSYATTSSQKVFIYLKGNSSFILAYP